MSKIKTINVVEYYDGLLRSVHAYTERTDAEAQFKELASENGFTEQEIASNLSKGSFLYKDDYEIYLIESE